MRVLVSDPNLQLSYKQNEIGISGDTLTTTQGLTFFKIKTTIVKARNDKNSCKEYATPYGYKECAEKSLRKKLMLLLGCIPPWMSQLYNEPVCYHDVEFNNETQAKYVKAQMALIVKYIMLNYVDVLNFEGECKLPCTQIHFSVQRTRYFDFKNSNVLIMKFDDSVKILEERNDYDLFALMVEVGSSLGLWIGLSAIGLFDLSLEFLHWSVHALMGKKENMKYIKKIKKEMKNENTGHQSLI